MAIVDHEQAYLSRILRADRVGAIESLREAIATHGLSGALELVVARAQATVGERWAAGTLSVADEHAATSVSEQAIDAVFPAAPSTPAGVAIAACPEGEWHSLSLRMVSAAATEAGFAVHFLGASVPSGDLVRYLDRVGPDLVLLSSAIPSNLASVRRSIEATRQTGTPVVVGGRGLGRDARRADALGADLWLSSAHEVGTALGGLPKFTSPAPVPSHPGFHMGRALETQIDDVVERAMRDLRDRAMLEASLQAADDSSLVGYVRDVVAALVSALLTDDRTILDDELTWLSTVFEGRGIGRERADDVLVAVLAALGERFPDAHALVLDQR